MRPCAEQGGKWKSRHLKKGLGGDRFKSQMVTNLNQVKSVKFWAFFISRQWNLTALKLKH